MASLLTPPVTYTVFESNVSAVFYCSGNGFAVSWKLNGSSYDTSHEQRGIIAVPNIPTGGVASSSLHIPAISANNNTVVVCNIADSTFNNVQSSEPSELFIQG